MKISTLIAAFTLSSALFMQEAQAAKIRGSIGFAGSPLFDTTSLAAATTVEIWRDVYGNLGFTNVAASSGSFTGLVGLGDQVTMAIPWIFKPSTATPGLWSVDGFSFNLYRATVVNQTPSFLEISGTGTVSGNGFEDTPFAWAFSVQRAGGVNSDLFTISASGANINVPTDFDQNGQPDYLLYNGATHRTAVWYMNNNVPIGSAFGPTLPAGWNVIDAVDFNGDGNPDYALFNPSTRRTAIWYLSGVTLITGAFGPTLASGWGLVATADFNGNGTPDYVLYNASTRQTEVMLMNNNQGDRTVPAPTLPAGWRLAGVADFNGDGNIDYLLFNANTGHTAIWYLAFSYVSGVTAVSGANTPTIGSGFQLQGTADFNGDGKPDYLLYNPSTHHTAIWYMDNNVFLSSASGPTLPVGWSLVAP